MGQAVKQAVVVAQTALAPGQLSESVAFFNPDGTAYDGLPTDASGVAYDNDDSNLTAEDVQAAIDEVVVDIADVASDLEDAAATINVLEPVVTATVIATAAKVVTTEEPAANTFVLIKFTNGNSAASMTVNFDSAGARPVLLGGSAPSGAESTFAADGVGMYWFDGTSLHQIGVYS